MINFNQSWCFISELSCYLTRELFCEIGSCRSHHDALVKFLSQNNNSFDGQKWALLKALYQVFEPSKAIKEVSGYLGRCKALVFRQQNEHL